MLVQVKEESLNAILSKTLKTIKKKCGIACSRKKKILGEIYVKWNLIFNEQTV